MINLSPPVFESPERDSFETSLWYATALPRRQFPTLEGAHSADVAVIGGGYTGLSTALHLAEQGKDVVVLDAREPGFGASGRNGGQVIPAFKYDPDSIAEVYGETMGQAVLAMVAQTADVVFDLVRRFNIPCDPEQTGWIQAAYGDRGASVVEARFRQWKAHGAPVDLLDAQQLRHISGTAAYARGLLFRKAGTVQPLSYARGLANAATSLGVRIFANSMVEAVTRISTGWQVTTAGGVVNAPQVVFGTNGYTTPLWPRLNETIVPLYSIQVASDPLPEELRREVLPMVSSMADTRRLVWYFRKDRDHRFVIGSRGPFKAAPSVADAGALVKAVHALYPSLRKIAFSRCWSGRVAMTADQVPHLHQLAPGVFAGLGYNGRGVGMATMMGKILAAACLGAARDGLPYPVSEMRPIPFHTFHRLGVQAMVLYYRMLDQHA